jgi:hypothetical protein
LATSAASGALVLSAIEVVYDAFEKVAGVVGPAGFQKDQNHFYLPD